MDNSDLTPVMQEMLAEMAGIRAEINRLKERAQALPPASPPTAPAAPSTRRKILKRLGLALLGGAAAATAVGGVPAQAKVIANPALARSTSKAGAIVVPLGAAIPTGTAPDAFYYGLIASGTSTALDLSALPTYSTGVYGTGKYGVYGDGFCGVYGDGTDFGVCGSSANYGVYGNSTNYAGYFQGNVLLTGTLTAGAKSFKIDHPLDSANKYLYHTSVESPDMMNIYNGIVALDDQGEALVEMPAWFEALNSDYRYQLTCLGQYAPVYLAEKLANGKFKIAGGKPGQEVSWQVTGIRQDAYARAHRSPVEEDKTADEKGKYLHPELFGQPEDMAVGPRPLRPKER